MLQVFFGLCTLVTTIVLAVSVLLALIVATGTPDAWPLSAFMLLSSALTWWTSVALFRRIRTPVRLHLAWTVLWTAGAIPPLNAYVLGSLELLSAWVRTVAIGRPTKVYAPNRSVDDPTLWITSAICLGIAAIAFFGGSRFHRWWKKRPESKSATTLRKGLSRSG